MHFLNWNTFYGSKQRVPSEVDSYCKLFDEGLRDTAQSSGGDSEYHPL